MLEEGPGQSTVLVLGSCMVLLLAGEPAGPTMLLLLVEESGDSMVLGLVPRCWCCLMEEGLKNNWE